MRILKRIDNPTAQRPYLREPNYYRLGYQLSAQLMNSTHSEKGTYAGRVRRHVHRTPSGSGEPPAVNRKRARTSAERLEQEARETLDWYQRRIKAGWWTLPKRLSPTEERLRLFLASTVEPCLKLVIAAVRRTEDPDAADHQVEPLRKEAKSGGSLSYRAVYNLACYEANGDEKGLSNAVSYLRLALQEAPEDRQQEMVRWAAKDPSLSELHGVPGFVATLETFGEPLKSKSKSKPG